MFKITSKSLARAGIIASLYVATSFLTFPLASGAVQFRIGESLTLLALFMPESIIALFIGCVISNLITGCALLDIFLGSLITGIASVLTFLVGKLIKSTALKVFVGGLFPVLLNAIFLPLIWLVCYGAIEYVYYIQVLLLLIGQSLSVYGVGSIVYIETYKLLNKKKS